MTDSKKTKEVMGDGILVLPEKRNDYRPVINSDKNGVQIRWASLVSVSLVVVLLLISSGSFLWSGLNEVLTEKNLNIKKDQLLSGSFERDAILVEVSNKKEQEKYGELNILAGTGDPLAQYKCGIMCFDGYGAVPKDEATALYWWKKAAAQGHLPSIHNVAIRLWSDGVRKKLHGEVSSKAIKDAEAREDEAVKMMVELVEEKGYRPARRTLGTIYYYYSNQKTDSKTFYEKSAIRILDGENHYSNPTALPLDRSVVE